MSLTDPEGNKAGGSTGRYPYTWERYLPSTGLVTKSQSGLLYARNRAGNVRGAKVTLPDNTIWRKPTSYSRNIIKFTGKPYSQRWVSGSHKGGYLNSMTSDIVDGIPIQNEFLPMLFVGYAYPEYIYNDRAQAITECLMKIGDGKANLAESLVTYKQTVDMFASTASSLFKALIHAKRGQWGAIPKDFGLGKKGGAAGHFLQFQYGWKPLMQDIHDLYEDVRDAGKPKSLLITARRVVRGNHSYKQKSTRLFEGRVADWTTTSSYSTTCHLTGKLSDIWLRRGTQYGLNNPAALAWELVPWSFVVDWAMPIGNVLQAFTAPAGLDFVSGYTSARIQGRRIASISGPNVGPAVQGSPSEHMTERFSFRRDALPGWPSPLPYVKSPLSTTHTLNALALLRQLLK